MASKKPPSSSCGRHMSRLEVSAPSCRSSTPRCSRRRRRAGPSRARRHAIRRRRAIARRAVRAGTVRRRRRVSRVRARLQCRRRSCRACPTRRRPASSCRAPPECRRVSPPRAIDARTCAFVRMPGAPVPVQRAEQRRERAAGHGRQGAVDARTHVHLRDVQEGHGAHSRPVDGRAEADRAEQRRRRCVS